MTIIDSNWVSTMWKWSEICIKLGKEQLRTKRRNNTQNNTKTQNTKIENKRSQQQHKRRRNIKKR